MTLRVDKRLQVITFQISLALSAAYSGQGNGDLVVPFVTVCDEVIGSRGKPKLYQ